jgi:cell wall-associated NlpC family hydrolase
VENGRRRTTRALIAVSFSLTVSLATLIPGASQADPQPAPLTIDQVTKQVDTLQNDAEVATESANEIGDELTAIKQRVAALQSDVTRQQAAVATLRNRVGQFAAAQYRSDGKDTTVQLLLATQPDDFLSRMSTTASLTDQQGASLTALASQQKVLAEKQAAVVAEQSRLTDAQNRADADRTLANQKLAASRALLARLTAAEKARLAAIEAANEKRAAAAVRASRDATRTAATATPKTTGKTGSGSSGSSDPTGGAPASGRAATALAFAKAQLGEPYVFGAAGPNSWDCSGLTMMAWRAAGVSLPHSAHEQYNVVGHKVSKADLQPGDLVMFYGGMHHVGIYAGNGMVIHAPRPGKGVEYLPMKYMPFAGAVRPG